MTTEWIEVQEELPARGKSVWLYDSMFGTVIPATITFEPDRLDGDFSHWMPRTGSIKPRAPENGRVHANVANIKTCLAGYCHDVCKHATGFGTPEHTCGNVCNVKP